MKNNKKIVILYLKKFKNQYTIWEKQRIFGTYLDKNVFSSIIPAVLRERFFEKWG